MRTYLSSSATFFRFNTVVGFVRGFTLIELLISISIIGIISALVVVRFSAFDSSVLLKSSAYEVALAIRDAQVYAVSVRGQVGNFDYPYGVRFVRNTNTYTFFRYTNSDVTAVPRYDTSAPHNAQEIKTYTMGSSFQITDLCINTGSGDVCNKGEVNVSFRRPEFNALFYDGGSTGINTVKIKVKSTRGNDIWIVEIGLLGHVSVYKE